MTPSALLGAAALGTAAAAGCAGAGVLAVAVVAALFVPAKRRLEQELHVPDLGGRLVPAAVTVPLED